MKLEFKNVLNFPYGIQAIHFFPNGFGVSVVRNDIMSYGAKEGLYELAVLEGDEEDWRLTYDTPITNDVVGWLTLEDAEKLADDVKNLPS